MNAEDLAAIKMRHYRLELVACCGFCHQFWPCDAARLATEVGRRRGVTEQCWECSGERLADHLCERHQMELAVLVGTGDE